MKALCRVFSKILLYVKMKGPNKRFEIEIEYKSSVWIGLKWAVIIELVEEQVVRRWVFIIRDPT